MTIADVIEYAQYGELEQLGVNKLLESTKATDVVKGEKRVLSYINLGLIELYKRFQLRVEETVLTLSEDTSIYTLSSTNVGVYLSKLNGEVNEIVGAYDELGNEYSINDETDPLSILTPSYNTLQVPNPTEGAAVYIVYVAAPTKIVWVDDLTTIEVPIPSTLLEALLHYIGYRAHGAMDGAIQAESNTHYMRFDASCKKAKELGVTDSGDGLLMKYSLLDKGFI